MKYFTLIILFSFYSTINCLQCYSNSTDPSITDPTITCNDPFCFVILVITGSDNTATYVGLEGCGSVIHEDPMIKPLNLTCQDNVTQNVTTSIWNVAINAMLYCCKTDLCNSQIPGVTIPTPILQTLPLSTTPKSMTQNPSTSTILSSSSSTVTSHGNIVSLKTEFFVFFAAIIFFLLK